MEARREKTKHGLEETVLVFRMCRKDRSDGKERLFALALASAHGARTFFPTEGAKGKQFAGT